MWPVVTCSSGAVDIPAGLQSGKSSAVILMCCSLLQAYEDSAAQAYVVGAGQVYGAMVLVRKSGFGKQTAEYGR